MRSGGEGALQRQRFKSNKKTEIHFKIHVVVKFFSIDSSCNGIFFEIFAKNI
jgi:hypothetical protein